MVTLTSTGEPWLPPGFSEALTLPMALAGSLRLTPEEFAEVCEANPDAVLELGGCAGGADLCSQLLDLLLLSLDQRSDGGWGRQPVRF
jgi:hypothetical protein